jgi:putative transcriptional regulator
MWDVAAHERADEQGGRAVEPGTLLVAAPGLLDPNFRRTVVYIIEHRGEGTLGVVLNRPSEVSLRDVLPAWAPHSSRPRSVFVGGPVDAKTALCLAAFLPGHDPATIGGVVAVRGPVALVDLDSDPTELAPRLRGLRVFAGYAGWNSGQLDSEIGRGDWILVPALPDDVLVATADDLWGRVLRRQGMPLALLSTFPADVARN